MGGFWKIGPSNDSINTLFSGKPKGHLHLPPFKIPFPSFGRFVFLRRKDKLGSGILTVFDQQRTRKFLEGYSLMAKTASSDSDVREMENSPPQGTLSSGKSEERGSTSLASESSSSEPSTEIKRPRQSLREDLYDFTSHKLQIAPPPIPTVIEIAIPMMRDRVEGLNHPGQTSSVSLDVLHKIANSIPWPQGVELCLPEDKGTSLACYEDCLVVHTFSIEAGFRLPLPDHYRDFLQLNSISASQIYPNGWRYLAAYTMRCYAAQVTPRGDRMVGLFIAKHDGAMVNLSPSSLSLVNKPSNVGRWRNSWFLVRSRDASSFNCAIHPTPFLRPKKPAKSLITSWRNAIYLERTPLDYKKLITAENLEKAGLSLSRRSDMVSSKFLKVAKAKGASSSRTVSEIAIPGNETRYPTALADKPTEIIAVEASPEKTSKERRSKRKHKSSSEQKESKKKKKIAAGGRELQWTSQKDMKSWIRPLCPPP